MSDNKLTASERKKRIKELQAELAKRLDDWKRMPRRSSFSGIHCADRIDAIQRELDKLGDKSKRHYVELTIEVG